MPRLPASALPKTPEPASRRSPCPVACALDLFGDRWTLLVIRDLFLGRTRFKDFTASPEGIPTNLLSDRLERLTESGLISRVPLEGGKRFAYELTEKGKALKPVLHAMKEWGLRWEEGTRADLLNQS
jgi:DNA-binding HxlR family transcriptional regulator